jgi:hypothetical protein
VAVAPENPNRRDSALQTAAQREASMQAVTARRASSFAKKEKLFFGLSKIPKITKALLPVITVL